MKSRSFSINPVTCLDCEQIGRPNCQSHNQSMTPSEYRREVMSELSKLPAHSELDTTYNDAKQLLINSGKEIEHFGRHTRFDQS